MKMHKSFASKYKKNFDSSEVNIHDYNVLFLKTDKVGEGELGQNLLVGFLSTLKI